MISRIGLAMTALLLASTSFANAADHKTAYLTAKDAGPDFAVQGEYAADGAGLQVIARGDGQFEAAYFHGGLPGAGWDGGSRKMCSGKTADGKTVLSGEDLEAEITADAAVVTTGGESTTLKKVMRKSDSLGRPAPKSALILFNGENVDHWVDGKIEEGHLLGVGTRTKQTFGDFTLHLEFRTPFMPYATGQARGNSGMYLGDQYECQVLDSFGLEGKDNECGGIYKNAAPVVNMCLPPLSWQTYDVEFKAAKFNDAGEKTANAVCTIKHNGVVIHDNQELDPTPGGGRNDSRPGALFLQNHGDPVRFRNIWIVDHSANE